MDIREAEDYLLGLELFGMRFGLDRMWKLMTVLGMPQRRFASIHVVGTNGKSSTTRMIAAILECHGFATGAYMSPHLSSFAERIEVGGRPVSDADFAAAVGRVRAAARLVDRTLPADDRVTQFELLTAVAYDELARRGVKVAVVEAGLGGRFDATNVIPSSVQVLTGVGLEHTRWLGPTLTDIAREKLAVVREGATLVLGEDLAPEAAAVARAVSAERGARIVVARPSRQAPRRALGGFQRVNLGVAEAAAEAFLGRLDADAVRAAADSVVIPGRLQVVAEDPLVVLDGAHNPSGAEALAAALPEVVGERPVVAVIGILDDKDAAGMLRALLPSAVRAVFTRPSNARALPPATLANLGAQLGGPPSEVVADPRAALDHARTLAGARGAVVVTGSIYLIADLVRERGARRASSM